MIGGPNLQMFELSPIWLSCCFLVLCESTLVYDNNYIFLPIFSSPPDGGSSGIESHLPVSHPTPGTRIVDHALLVIQRYPLDHQVT